MSKTISREDYYKIVGLLTIAEQHLKVLTSVERALDAITGEGKFNRGGHCGDATYGQRDADDLLRVLHIEVSDAKD